MENVTQAPHPQPKKPGRVLARTLAEDMRQAPGNWPVKTQTHGLGGFTDTDLA